MKIGLGSAPGLSISINGLLTPPDQTVEPIWLALIGHPTIIDFLVNRERYIWQLFEILGNAQLQTNFTAA